MIRKKCSVRGFEYDEGSLSDVIHQYIEASTPDELNKIIKDILTSQQRLIELQNWKEGILAEFTPHFTERFRSLEAESDPWKFEVSKWITMGFVLERLTAYKWAEEISRALYNIFCDLQAEKGRIHKGDPLHYIGWINLLIGTEETIKKSKYYMKLAMIEDYLTNEATYSNLPAYKVLRGEHNISDTYLNNLIQGIKTYKARYAGDPFLRPELIYLDYATNPKNLERSSICDFDIRLAKQLMNRVEQAKTAAEKGSSYEILLSYLFASTPGFEVLRNINTYDAQIDILIRNLQKNDPLLNEFGKYIIVECRNIEDKIDAKAIRDFSVKVFQASCNSGILVSKKGVTGENEQQAARDARMAILKVHQRQGVVIVPLTSAHIELITQGQVSLLDVLVSEYEKIRFDIT